MNKRVKVKLKLMRVVHGVEEVWITKDDVFISRLKNFTGVYYAWHSNGWLKYEENWKDGKGNGLSRAWYSNGQLKHEWNYKNGKFHGLCRIWYDSGQLKYRKNWKDGELIE